MAVFATTGLPGCIGANYGTHVHAVCDNNRKFWDADIGRADAVHDSHMLRESELYQEDTISLWKLHDLPC
eukprot:358551-Chlamydomonas_euryale.AAC.3